MTCPFPTTREKKWPQVILSPISISDFIITVSSTIMLHPKQIVDLSKAGQETKQFEIKRIINETQLYVGPYGNHVPMHEYSNPVEFDGGTFTVQEQNRNGMGSEIVLRAVYSEEPAVALRNVLVDWRGAYYCTDNPIPVRLSDGSINIETLNANLAVQLSHLDNYPTLGDVHDSVRIGGPNGTEMIVNLDGSINTSTSPKQTSLTILNIPIAAANTDTPISFPPTIQQLTMRIRDGKGVLKIFKTSGGDYSSIARGAAYNSGIINDPALSLIVQSSQPGVVLEVEYRS